MPGCWFETSTCLGEAEARHVGVDSFGLVGSDLVRLVPDANGAVVANALVESFPRRQMGCVACLCIGDEMVEASPILCHRNASPVDGSLCGEKAERGVGVELLQHGAHGFCDGKPFVDCEQAVDLKSDEEDDEGAFYFGGVASWEDGRHMRKLYNWLSRFWSGETSAL
jgi:hypothetical protein